MELWDESAKIATVSNSPVSKTFTGSTSFNTLLLANGSHNFFGVPYDTIGQQGFSGFSTVTVNNPVLAIPTWAVNIISSAQVAFSLSGVAIDSANNVIAAGLETMANSTGTDFGTGRVAFVSGDTGYIAKYNKSGLLQWVRILGSGNNSVQVYSVATDTHDNILATGYYRGTPDFGDYGTNTLTAAINVIGSFVVKYSPSNSLLWVRGYGGVSGTAIGTAITTDGNDNVMWGGRYNCPTINLGSGIIISNSFGSFQDPVVKVSPTGSTIWGRQAACNGNSYLNSIAADPSGNVIFTGNYDGGTSMNFGSGAVGSGGIYIANYGAFDGSLQWAKVPGGGSGNGVCSDPVNGDVFATGSGSASLDFGGGATNVTGYIVRYDSSGFYKWVISSPSANQIASNGKGDIAISGGGVIANGYTTDGGFRFTRAGNTGTSVKYNSNSNLVAAGSFIGTLSLGAGTNISAPANITDGFVVQYTNVISGFNPVTSFTYYVDPVSGNDANAGTATNTAWQHIPGALTSGSNYLSGAGWKQLNDGDKIIVKGGTTNRYQVRFTIPNYITNFPGYNANLAYGSIVIQSGDLATPAWGSGRAIFDEGNTNTFGFWLAMRGGITLDGFEIRNIAGGAVGIGFDAVKGSCGVAIGGAYEVDYCRVTRCYIHNSNRVVGDDGHGIETDGGAGGTTPVSHDLMIDRNLIGPSIGTKGIEIQIYNRCAVSNNFVTGTKDHGVVITGNHCDVNNNVVYMTPPYYLSQVFGIKANNNLNDVWNNLVYQSPQSFGVSNALEGIGTLDNASSNRFVHNTIINCANLTASADRQGQGVSIADEDVLGTNNVFMNNIVAFSTNNNSANWYNVQLYVGTGVVNSTVGFCDLWSGVSGTKVIADHVSSAGGYNFYTASEANSASPIRGNTFANNQQLDPVFTGGGLPTGLDSTYRPNSNYFLPLQGSVPLAVASTKNTISGDSIHGYSSSPTKFATDIAGVGRSQWTMGAYEVGVSTPGIYKTWTVAATNWTASTVPVTVPAGNSIVFVGGYVLQALSSGNTEWTIGGGIVGATNYFKSTGLTNYGRLQLTSAPFTTTTNIPNAVININGFGQVSDHNTASFIICIMTNTPYPITPLVDGVAMTYLQFPATAASETATPASQPGDLMFDIIVTPANPFTNALGQTFITSVSNGTATLRASWAVATSTSTPMTWTGTADTLSHIAVAISQRKSTAYVTNLRMQQ